MKKRREFKVVPNYIPTDSDLDKVEVVIVGSNKDKLNESIKVLEGKEFNNIVFQVPNKVVNLSEFTETDNKYKLASEFCEDTNLYALYPPLLIQQLHILKLNYMFGGGIFTGGEILKNLVVKVI